MLNELGRIFDKKKIRKRVKYYLWFTGAFAEDICIYIGPSHTYISMCAAVFFIGGVVAFTMICRSSCEGMFVDSGGDRCGWFSPDGRGCRRCLSKKAGGSIIKVYYYRDGCILGGLLI